MGGQTREVLTKTSYDVCEFLQTGHENPQTLIILKAVSYQNKMGFEMLFNHNQFKKDELFCLGKCNLSIFRNDAVIFIRKRL